MVLAWRHKVDHAANHLYIVPNTDFTPDIAEHIIGAVRIFMRRLLEGIPV
jgi:plasmid stabilization system protein ParE